MYCTEIYVALCSYIAMRSAINISYITMYKEYNVVDDICLLDRLRFAVLVTGEFLIFSSGKFHKFAVSCVSYP